MNRLPFAALVAALAIVGGSIGLVACGSSNSSNVAKNVTSQPGDGAKDDSLFMQDNLTTAIKKFTDKFGSGPVQNFKIEPNSIKATSASGVEIVTKDGSTEGTKIPGGVTIPTGGGGFAPGDIDTAAPEKIVKSLSSKGVTLANTNYFLVSSALAAVSTGTSSKPGWLIYTTKGDFQADADGSNAKPLGSVPSSITTPGGTTVDTKKLEDTAKTAASEATNAAKAAEGTAQSLQDCISKAGTDPTKLAACAGH